MSWNEIPRADYDAIIEEAGGLGALRVFSCLTDPEGQYGTPQIYTAWGSEGDEHPLVDITDYKDGNGRTTRQVCRKFIIDTPDAHEEDTDMPSGSPFHHIYDRIAKRANREFAELGVNLTAEHIQDVVEDHARRPMKDEVETFIRNEACEYGIEVTG